MNEKTKKLVESALMIALALILNNVFRIKVGAAGGSITLFSMLPLNLLGYRHGVRWGVLCGAAYGLLDMMTSFTGAAVIDYLLAYGAMGLGGVFRHSIKSQTIGYTAGSALAVLVRFACHFVSGFLVWGSLVSDGFGAIAYSFTYNIAYMGPEMVTTILGALVLSKVFSLASASITRKKMA